MTSMTNAAGAGAPVTVAPLGTRGVVAREAIVRLCAGTLPALELLEHVNDHVRSVVPYALAGWGVTDPTSMLFTGLITVDFPIETHMRVLDHDLIDGDINTFRDIARRRRPVASIYEATDGDVYRSARMRTIARPIGMAHELRAVFSTGRASWGNACLVRDEASAGFSPDEIAFLDSVRDHVAHGLRSALLLDAARDDVHAADKPDAVGMVVVDADDGIESMTAAARRWLSELPGDRRVRLELPSIIYRTARCARLAAQGRYSGPSRVRARLSSGRWLAVHAAQLYEADGTSRRTAVVLEPATRAELAPLLLDLHELTDREREMTGLLMRGLSTDEIARMLWISRYTVRDHVKAIFAKLGVTSRPELTALLFHDHLAPRLDHRLITPGSS